MGRIIIVHPKKRTYIFSALLTWLRKNNLCYVVHPHPKMSRLDKFCISYQHNSCKKFLKFNDQVIDKSDLVLSYFSNATSDIIDVVYIAQYMNESPHINVLDQSAGYVGIKPVLREVKRWQKLPT